MPDTLMLAASLLGCDRPVWAPMAVIETVNGADVARETSMAMACGTCATCKDPARVPLVI